MNADNRIGSKHITRITGMLLVCVFVDKELIQGSFQKWRLGRKSGRWVGSNFIFDILLNIPQQDLDPKINGDFLFKLRYSYSKI